MLKLGQIDFFNNRDKKEYNSCHNFVIWFHNDAIIMRYGKITFISMRLKKVLNKKV